MTRLGAERGEVRESAREQLQRWEMKAVEVHWEVEHLRWIWPLLDRIAADPRLFAALRRQQKTEAEWSV